MKKFSIIIIILLIFSACNSCNDEQLPIVIESEPSVIYDDDESELDLPIEWRSSQLLNCNFHVQWEFDIAAAQAEIYDVPGKIISGVIPHHLLAGRMITSFLKTAADNNPDVETIIMIAPIHFAEDVKLATTMSDWATPYGILPTDINFSGRFIRELGAEINDTVIEDDHSAAALMPFIKYYFPHANVATLLIESSAPHDISERLSVLLAEFAEEKNCLFLFSVDFSHYLMPDEVYYRDDESRKAILENDFERIRFMTNANMDSPKSIMAFLKLNELLNLKLHELEHSNSMEILSIPYPNPIYDEGLTSYFIFAGTRNNNVELSVSVAAVGDNLIHAPIYGQARRRAIIEGDFDFNPAYENITKIIAEHDLAMINMETLIIDAEPSCFPFFSSPIALGDYLLSIGFNVFALANNHTLDKGTDGLTASLDYWNSRNAVTAGAYYNITDRNNIRTKEINGIKFSFLSYTEHLNGLFLPADSELQIGDLNDFDTVIREIKNAKEITDVCVVFLHWGTENYDRVENNQREIARLLSEAGADVILGTHPHVLRDIEFIERSNGEKTLVAYSLGNFISAQNIPQTMIGGILSFDVKLNTETKTVEITDVVLHPIITHYDNEYRFIRIYPLEMYNEEKALMHGVNKFGEFSIDYINKILGNVKIII
jgi:poly-gamma-glutamate synthesis protein (capsule biosynthesis protein)